MLKRPESELHIVRPRDPLPTVEVDLDSIPEVLHGYEELVVRAMTPVAEKSPNMTATIYVYQGPSVNFHQQTWSAFFGVAGDKKLLDLLMNAFREANVANVKFSDYIDSSKAQPEFHIYGGRVWLPYELGNWYTEAEDKANETADDIPEAADTERATQEADGCNYRNSNPSRYRAARSDATVGTISRRIEEVFGLPEGSVALCGPDKSALRVDAKIATLRRRWE